MSGFGSGLFGAGLFGIDTSPANSNYYFGSFLLNNMVHSFGISVQAKSIDMPAVRPATSSMARRDGVKKSGQMIEPRDVHVVLKVVGTSRVDLESRLDTLKQALFLQGQQLIIYEIDARYYTNVDCVSAPIPLQVGKDVTSATVGCTFRCYDPIAYSPILSTYDTGTVALTSANSLWNFAAITITGGGTYYSYPLFHITNKTSTGSTTLSAGLTSGNNYTSISVNATPFSASTGDQVAITHGGTTQTLTLSSPCALGATSISVSSFTASANYVSTDAVAKVTQWNALSISQTQDSQTLSVNTSSLVALPKNNGDYVDVQCDPAQTAGWSVQTNGSGLYSDPQGVFPVIEPGTTTFNISIASSSAITASCLISWRSRYL
jgi:hypothetical protein